jgi:hypothetical protein
MQTYPAQPDEAARRVEGLTPRGPQRAVGKALLESLLGRRDIDRVGERKGDKRQSRNNPALGVRRLDHLNIPRACRCSSSAFLF